MIPGSEFAATAAPSLEGLHGTVPVPPPSAGFWRQYRAFVGPAFLVSVGYMDPGNWGTDLQAGAQLSLRLLWVVALSSLMAIVMQVALRPARRRHRQGPGPGVPRLLPEVDPLAELARSASSPSPPATWPRCSAAPWRSICCPWPHPALLGRHHHRFRRAAVAGPARAGHALHRGGRSSRSSPPSAAATSSRFSSCRRRSRISSKWATPC